MVYGSWQDRDSYVVMSETKRKNWKPSICQFDFCVFVFVFLGEKKNTIEVDVKKIEDNKIVLIIKIKVINELFK